MSRSHPAAPMHMTGHQIKLYNGYMDARPWRFCDQKNVNSICLMLHQNEMDYPVIPSGITSKVLDNITLTFLEIENNLCVEGDGKAGKGTTDMIAHDTFEPSTNERFDSGRRPNSLLSGTCL